MIKRFITSFVSNMPVLKSAYLSLVIRVGGVALTLAAYILLARVMTKTEYGDFIYVVTAISVLSLFVQGGFQASVMRYFHEYAAQLHYQKGFIVTGFFLPLAIGVVVIFMAGALQSQSVFPPILHNNLAYITFGSLAFALTYVAQQSLKADGRIVLSQIFEQVGLPLVLLGLAAFALLGNNHSLAFEQLISSYIAVFVALAVITWSLFLKRSYPRNIEARYQLKEWVASSASMAGIGIVGALIPRLDILMIGLFLSSASVAQYGVAAKIAILLAFTYAALNNALTPVISKKYHSGETAQIQPMVRKLIRLSLFINFAAYGVLVLLSQTVLGFFGEGYVSASHLLVVLGFAQAANLSAGPLGSVLSITNHHNIYLRFNLAFLIILALVLWLTIPVYGLIAAAYSTASITVLMNVALIVLVRRKTGLLLI